ncbi:MAG: hypothetical protein JW849_08690 [Phycisphaerae bacterium]|nr:hypothetical protein [Phycisphaerae bacterium]
MLLNRSSQPIFPADQEWEKDSSFLAVAAIPDEETDDLLLYYLVRFEDKSLNNVLCLARSRDGCAWTKPDCGDGTNIVMRGCGNQCGWGEFMPATILRNPQETDPARRWKMVYWDRPDESMKAGICLAQSADGLDWQPVHTRPVIINHNDAMSMITTEPNLDPTRKKATTLIYQQTWKYNPLLPADRDNLKYMHRRISLWVAEDFAGGWRGPITIFEPDEQDVPDVQFYWLTPFRTTAGGFGGLLNCHHTEDQTMDVQLLSSPNGWVWKRENDRTPILPLGPRGGFDCGSVIAVAQPVRWRGKVLLFYTGLAAVHDGKPRYGDEPLPNPSQGIGLAEFSDELLNIGK